MNALDERYTDESDPYNEDEWYDEGDYDEPEYGWYELYLGKADNGHLFVEEVYALTNGRSDSFYWTWYDDLHPLHYLNADARAHAIAWGKALKPGKSVRFADFEADDFSDDGAPAGDPNDIPF